MELWRKARFVARGIGADGVRWMAADALDLPFPDAAFDTVLCQFGVMFFADKVRGLREARRVLRPHGTLIFSVWKALAESGIAATVNAAVGELFPGRPLRFMEQVPHGYHDHATIEADLAAAGFTQAPRFDTFAAAGRAPSARHAAIACCQGTPLRAEIEERDCARMDEAVRRAEAALVRRFGGGAIAADIKALFVTMHV